MSALPIFVPSKTRPTTKALYDATARVLARRESLREAEGELSDLCRLEMHTCRQRLITVTHATWEEVAGDAAFAEAARDFLRARALFASENAAGDLEAERVAALATSCGVTP